MNAVTLTHPERQRYYGIGRALRGLELIDELKQWSLDTVVASRADKDDPYE